MEKFRDIKGYEEMYQISNFGNIKSLPRVASDGRNIKGRILKQSYCTSGYLQVNLYKNKKPKRYLVHQLVAIAFLNHKPNGHKLVVNHIDFNKINNRFNNLEIVTARENTNLKHIKSTSKYVGVYWCKLAKKWRSRITIKGKLKHLGFYINEYNAHLAYQSALKQL